MNDTTDTEAAAVCPCPEAGCDGNGSDNLCERCPKRADKVWGRPVDDAASTWARLVAESDRNQLDAFIAIGDRPAVEGVSRIGTPLLRSYQRRGLTVRDARGVHTHSDLGRRVAAHGRKAGAQ